MKRTCVRCGVETAEGVDMRNGEHVCSGCFRKIREVFDPIEKVEDTIKRLNNN